MQRFIDTYADQFSTMSASAIENTLTHYFYQEATALDDAFVRQYFRFEKDLKSLVTAYHAVTFDLNTIHHLPEATLVAMLAKRNEYERSLVKTYPYFNTLMEALESNDPNRLEKTIDQLKWTYVDQLTGMSFFTHHNVLAYYIKMTTVAQWSGYDHTKGKQRLETLKNKLTAQFNDTLTQAI